MKTTHYLTQIIERKKKEVGRLIEVTQSNPNHVLNAILNQNRTPGKKFANALKKSKLAIIGEIKRRSPSAGTIQDIPSPIELALEYCKSGISAISVLTDQDGFGGSLDDLCQISKELNRKYPDIPTLRKDFIVHPLQLAEAVYHGASAVLLIVGVLRHDLKTFLDEANRLGLEALAEVHNREELELAIQAGCPIIGINHRNLNNFTIDLTLSEALISQIPDHIITVAESGILDPLQAKKMQTLGFDAILVGEALVRSQNRPVFIKQLIGGNGES